MVEKHGTGPNPAKPEMTPTMGHVMTVLGSWLKGNRPVDETLVDLRGLEKYVGDLIQEIEDKYDLNVIRRG